MLLGMLGNKYKEASEKVKDSCIKLAFRDSRAIEEMDHDTLDAMQAALKLLEASNEIIENQARVIDEINEKLDKLLVK